MALSQETFEQMLATYRGQHERGEIDKATFVMLATGAFVAAVPEMAVTA